MDETLRDRIYGVNFGQAIGDALGLGTEFLTKEDIRRFYPQGLSNYNQIVQDRHRRRWIRGDWTDDTDQMLCILDSLIEKRKVDILDIAYRLYRWATQGGMGIGKTVKSVLYSPDFLKDPHSASKQVWENSGRVSAANGGIMRTSILGIWEYQSHEKVKFNAEQVCRITHYDSRCIGSCIAVCLVISSMLQGQSDIDTLIKEVASESIRYDSRIQEFFDKALQKSLWSLDLDDQIGYTLKSMGAGFWALKNATSFEDGIIRVIHEGGDADSNAAVAGALLGARFGFREIPRNWVDGLVYLKELDRKVEKLIHLMSI